MLAEEEASGWGNYPNGTGITYVYSKAKGSRVDGTPVRRRTGMKKGEMIEEGEVLGTDRTLSRGLALGDRDVISFQRIIKKRSVAFRKGGVGTGRLTTPFNDRRNYSSSGEDKEGLLVYLSKRTKVQKDQIKKEKGRRRQSITLF